MFVILASFMTPSPRAQLWSSQLLVAIGYIEFFRTYSMGDLNVHVIPKISEAELFMKPWSFRLYTRAEAHCYELRPPRRQKSTNIPIMSYATTRPREQVPCDIKLGLDWTELNWTELKSVAILLAKIREWLSLNHASVIQEMPEANKVKMTI